MQAHTHTYTSLHAITQNTRTPTHKQTHTQTSTHTERDTEFPRMHKHPQANLKQRVGHSNLKNSSAS